MTVPYTAEVASSTRFGCFLKLLLRWRGSIYKLVWTELIAFLGIYYGLMVLYRYALDGAQKRWFEQVCEYCETYINLIPLSFVLGFYVSLVISRWWNQYLALPWVSPLAVSLSIYVVGKDEKGRLLRRTIMRYVCLCLVMFLTLISPSVKKRFPTLDHLVEAGLLLDSEKKTLEESSSTFPEHCQHWQPFMWAAGVVARAKEDNRIKSELGVESVISKLDHFREKFELLLHYDAVTIPLVYTQVVTLATYSFFLASVIGRQWLDVHETHPLNNHRNPIDYYFPVFATLQFVFYMGWLKVAESLINPFGTDDDDFEVNWFIDKNVTLSYLIVDQMHNEHPQLSKDQYWDSLPPSELPHTVASRPLRGTAPRPSTADVTVSSAGRSLLTSLKVEGEMRPLNHDSRGQP